MLGMWGKVKILPHQGLGAGLLGIPTLNPTTLRVLAGMEKAMRRPRKVVESVEKKGARERSERRAKEVTSERIMGYLWQKSQPSARALAECFCAGLSQVRQRKSLG